MKKSSNKRSSAHSRAILSDVFTGLALKNTDIARILGISLHYLLDILAERKPVSANTAVRIGSFLGQNDEIWLRMQAACGMLSIHLI